MENSSLTLNMITPKFTFKIFPVLLILCFGFVLPVHAQAAEQLPMGSVCTNNSQCKSGDCENGDDGKAYCDCDDDNDCSAQFNVQDGEQWTCKDDGPNDIDYCVSNLPGRTPAAFGGKPSNTDILLDPQLAGNEIKQMTNKPVLKINIPGLNFSKPQVTQGDDGGTYIQIPLIGEYIKALYRYGIAAAGIVAVVIIINAGFLWIRSAGSAEVIQQQKQSIEKAVIGLIIAVASYTILFAINPKLTEFQNLKVQYIASVDLDKPFGNEKVESEEGIPEKAANATPVNVKPGAMSYGFNNVPYFAQGVGEWANLPYGGESCTTYRQAGCGPTSLAMVLRFYGKDVDPRHIGAVATESEARSCRGGTSTTKRFLQALETQYNVKIQVITNKADALNLLRNGKPLVQGGPHVGFTNTNKLKSYEGHFIVLTGIEVVNGEEIIRVNDSGRASPENGIVYQTLPLFEQSVDRLIYISQ